MQGSHNYANPKRVAAHTAKEARTKSIDFEWIWRAAVTAIAGFADDSASPVVGMEG